MNPRMTLARSTRCLASAHFRALAGRVRANLRGQRFMSVTVVLFMAAYVVAAHALVSRGLVFLQRLPLLGPMLVERTLFLLFFFFFVMLVISNATITGVSLFRRSETGWLLSLPMPREGVVVWRTIEGLLLSSWGLVVLSAPILAAFGKVLEAGPAFYAASMLAVVLLIAIAANVSTWMLLLLVRFQRPWWPKAAALTIGALILFVVLQLGGQGDAPASQSSTADNIKQVLRHTQIAVHPLMPSSWVAETAIASSKGLYDRTSFHLGVLLSYALVVWVATVALARRWFFPAWNRAMKQNEARRLAGYHVHISPSRTSLWSRAAAWLRLPRPVRALCAKDSTTFVREPSQWGQCTLIFGLLLIYTTNLRHLGYNLTDPFWTTVISYLNFTVCGLAMSTLTTRFVFPQFSMEGRRFWIIGLAPFPLATVLRQKLWLNWLATTPLTVLLIITSCNSLRLPAHRASFFVAAIALLSIGLNALALGLGALLPNFREANSAKIVSSFGGTLCLILSFFYIITSVCILIIPGVLEQTNARKFPPDTIKPIELACVLTLGLVTMVVGGIPYLMAKNRTKKVAYLGKL